jgi:hypothetical protein
MSWFGRRRRSVSHPGGPVDGPGMTVDSGAVKDHLAAFVSSRRGVEAFVEPPTNVTATTVVLIAHDGEWTRRAVASRDAAFELPRALGIPVYDVNQTGYPSRMREWNSRQKRRPSAKPEPGSSGGQGRDQQH